MNDATREALLRLYDVPDPERPGEVIPGYDKDHAGRTTRIAMRVAQAVGLPEERLEDFETTALLHDLGRAGMDPEIVSASLKAVTSAVNRAGSLALS